MTAPGEAVYAAFEAVARVIRRAYQGTVTRRREDAVVDMLRTLDDRTLADIGVRRSEIRSVARQVVEPSHLDHRAPGQ